MNDPIAITIISLLCLALLTMTCCKLAATLPEQLLAEYIKDQAEMVNHQFPSMQKHHYGMTILVACYLAILAFHLFGSLVDVRLYWFIVLCWGTVLLAALDWRTRLLPDNVVYPFLWCGLLSSTMGVFCTPAASIFGAILGYTTFWLFQKITALITGISHSLGHGDMKMSAALGAWIGFSNYPTIILFSGILILPTGLIIKYLIAKKRVDKDLTIPFGLILASATWLFFTLFPHIIGVTYPLNTYFPAWTNHMK